MAARARRSSSATSGPGAASAISDQASADRCSAFDVQHDVSPQPPVTTRQTGNSFHCAAKLARLTIDDDEHVLSRIFRDGRARPFGAKAATRSRSVRPRAFACGHPHLPLHGRPARRERFRKCQDRITHTRISDNRAAFDHQKRSRGRGLAQEPGVGPSQSPGGLGGCVGYIDELSCQNGSISPASKMTAIHCQAEFALAPIPKPRPSSGFLTRC